MAKISTKTKVVPTPTKAYANTKAATPQKPKVATGVYGPATGHYSVDSIKTAMATGGRGGDRLIQNAYGGFDYTKDPTGMQERKTLDAYGNYTGADYGGYNEYSNRGFTDLLDQQTKKLLEAQRLATERGVAGLETQRTAAGQGYDEQARQAEIAYRQRQTLLPEQLAQEGVTGGGVATANLQSQLGLETSRQDIGTARQGAYRDIDQSIAQLRATGDIGAANIQAEAIGRQLEDFSRQQAYAREEATRSRAQTREDALASRGGAYSNIQAKINELKTNNDPSDDWLIPHYESDRQNKMLNQEEQAYKQAQDQAKADLAAEKWAYQQSQDAQKMALAQQRLAVSAAKKSGSGGSRGMNKTDALNSDMADVIGGRVSPKDVKSNRDALIRAYGANGYKKLYDNAKKYYKVPENTGVQYLTPF